MAYGIAIPTAADSLNPKPLEPVIPEMNLTSFRLDALV